MPVFSGDMERTAWEFEAQELLDIYKVDFIGPYELTKGLLPVLQKNNGTIINVSTPIEPCNQVVAPTWLHGC